MLSGSKVLTPQSRKTDSSVCNILLCALLLLLTTHSSSTYGQASGLSDFEPYVSAAFQKTRTIVFSGNDTLLIGEISTIDAGNDGRLVITDRIGNQAILFGGNGTYIAHLDARRCNPEVRFFIAGAKIRPDSQVLVLGTSPWGFLFDGNGICKSVMSIDFSGTRHNNLVLDGANKMIGLYHTGTGQVLRFMDGLGQRVGEVKLPRSPAPGVDFRWVGGGLAKTEKHIYSATLSSALTQLDLEGRLVRKFEFRNPWFRQIKQDIPDPFDPDIPRLDRHLTRIVKNRSRVNNLLLLDRDLIMIQYRNADRGFGLQVFDDMGNLVTELLGGKGYFGYARNGLAYRVIQPDVDDSGFLPNPYLDVYEYRGR